MKTKLLPLLGLTTLLAAGALRAGSSDYVSSPDALPASGPPCAGPTGYVSNTGADEVWVVDLNLQQVTAVIAVGSDPRGIAALPDGSRVYVANRFDDSVSVIDTALNTVVQTVSLASEGVGANEPYDVAVSPDGTFLAVAMKNGGSENGDGSVVFVDLASSALTEAPLDSSASPEGIVITPDGSRVFVAGRGSMYAVDVASHTFLGTAGLASRELAVTPDGEWVLASDNAVATDSLTVVKNAVFMGSRGVAISPDGLRVFTTSEGDRVDVYDVSRAADGTPSWERIGDITNDPATTQRGAYGIDLTSDGLRGLVSWRGRNTVQVFSTETLSFISAPIPMEFGGQTGSEPKQLVIVDRSGAGPGALTASVLTAPALNFQTGLYEQRVRVSNTSCEATAVELRLTGLAAGTTVYNASGTRDGVPFLLYSRPIAIGASVTLLVEYYRSDRAAPGAPAFTAVGVTPETSPAPAGERFEITRTANLAGGVVLVEFNSDPGRQYVVEYSADLETWAATEPPVTAAGNRVQWLDQGPPQTPTPPDANAQRYYRVVKLPTQ